MRRAAAWTAAVVGSLSLAACDLPEGRGAADARRPSKAFDASAPENAPEPARFAKFGPPQADPEAEPAPLAGTAGSSLLAAASPAPRSDDEAAAADAGRIFDARAARPAPLKIAAATTPAAPVPAPVRASGVKRNSPVPDRKEDGSLVLENRQFAVDTDGLIVDPVRRRQVVAHDRTHRDGTALYVGGRPLDSTVVPYISIPMDFKGARVGDMAKVCRAGRCAWAVIGDVGPDGRFGEGSVALAESLGLDSDGDTGGATSGVTYTLYPGMRAPMSHGQTRLASDLAARGGGAPVLLADAL